MDMLVETSTIPSHEVTEQVPEHPGPAATPPEVAGSVDKPAYPPPAALPTQLGPLDIRFDFNLGARLVVPEGSWHVQLQDLDTGNILFETNTTGGTFICSTKRYYLRIGIEVRQRESCVFRHEFDAEDREVLVQFPVGTLGDPIGWFPYAVKFQERHNCRLTCAMSELLIPLFKGAYPDITFVTHDAVDPEKLYATYCLGLFFDDGNCFCQPCDFRLVALHRTADYILGVDSTEVPPRIALKDDTRPMDVPYN